MHGAFSVFVVILGILWYLFQELLYNIILFLKSFNFAFNDVVLFIRRRKCIYRTIGTLMTLCVLFLCAWFISGSVWVYSIANTYQSKDSFHEETYCNGTLYLFAFWTLTCSFILLGIGFLLSFIFGLAIFFSRNQTENEK